MQIPNKHIKRCSTSCSHQEMQIKTTVPVPLHIQQGAYIKKNKTKQKKHTSTGEEAEKWDSYWLVGL